MLRSVFFKFLTLLSLTLFSLTCTDDIGRDEGVDNDSFGDVDREAMDSSSSVQPDSSLFHPDLTVNGIVRLGEEKTLNDFIGEGAKPVLVELVRENIYAQFRNEDQTVYLLAYEFEGDHLYEFSRFEIGNLKDAEDVRDQPFVETGYEQFASESGLMLGMSPADIVKIKGPPTRRTETGNRTSDIWSIDGQSDPLIQSFNLPQYDLKVLYQDGKAVKIEFGFQYP